MCIFKNINSGSSNNVPNIKPVLSLTSPDLLWQNKTPAPNDNYKPSFGKNPFIPLINPFQLFSAKAIQGSPSVQPNGVSIQWTQQFNDPSVAGGSRPKGYSGIDGVNGIPKSKITEVAKFILSKNQPLGTCTPFEIDGFKLMAVDQRHNWTTKNGKVVQVPEGLHGVTIVMKS
jgi:hypothetical protein